MEKVTIFVNSFNKDFELNLLKLIFFVNNVMLTSKFRNKWKFGFLFKPSFDF